jgi:hypothetical protein
MTSLVNLLSFWFLKVKVLLTKNQFRKRYRREMENGKKKMENGKRKIENKKWEIKKIDSRKNKSLSDYCLYIKIIL